MKLTRNVQVARLSGWILLILLIGASGFRTYDAVSELPNAGFYDHGIFLRQVDTYHRTGRLYDVHRREFFHPGSAVFKYPPPAALLYIALREPGTSRWSQARPVVVASFVALAGSLILICAVFKPPLWRVVLLIVVFMNWRGHWESLSAPQWEPLLLLPLTLCVVLPPKRGWFSGLVIGIAGAVKLYPWLMAGYFALRLQWRNLLGVGIGACIAFSASSFLLTQDLSVQFLSQILPRLGGISLSN